MRMLGQAHDKVPLHVQEGLDAAKKADSEIRASRTAARSYWAAVGKPAADDLARVQDELESLEKRRQERR